MSFSQAEFVDFSTCRFVVAKAVWGIKSVHLSFVQSWGETTEKNLDALHVSIEILKAGPTNVLNQKGKHTGLTVRNTEKMGDIY